MFSPGMLMDMKNLKLKEHSFKKGYVLMQILDDNNVQQYFVEEIVSKYKIKVRLYNENGLLSESSRIFYGSDFDTLIINTVSTNLVEELNERESIRQGQNIQRRA